MADQKLLTKAEVERNHLPAYMTRNTIETMAALLLRWQEQFPYGHPEKEIEKVGDDTRAFLAAYEGREG